MLTADKQTLSIHKKHALQSVQKRSY